MKSYKPEELFDQVAGSCRNWLNLPEGKGWVQTLYQCVIFCGSASWFHLHAVKSIFSCAVNARIPWCWVSFYRCWKTQSGSAKFQDLGPDETISNFWALYLKKLIVSGMPGQLKMMNSWLRRTCLDSMLAKTCEGWLEIFLPAAWIFNSYEASSHHWLDVTARKWLKVTNELPWRRKIASWIICLPPMSGRIQRIHTSDPVSWPFINKKADIVCLFAPDAIVCCRHDHCCAAALCQRMVAGKHPLPQWLTMEDAVVHCRKELVWKWRATIGCRAGCGNGLLRRYPYIEILQPYHTA